jgi:hypothetical protein
MIILMGQDTQDVEDMETQRRDVHGVESLQVGSNGVTGVGLSNVTTVLSRAEPQGIFT